jgi:hypothetical protein
VAADAQLDVLLIKGPSLAFHGLRGERAWGDVDLLVRPGHVSALRRQLAATGWTAIDETPDFPLITPPHAITVVHPRWHTEIDVHTFLPGCYADPATVFEQLWPERAVIELAHQPVLCTGRIGSALVGALNLARTPSHPRTIAERAQWRAAVSAWPTTDRDALAQLAADCHAADVLAPLLDAAGVPSTGRNSLTPAEWRDWHDRVGREAQRGYVWAAAIRRAPLRQKPQLVMRALTHDPDAAARGMPQPKGWRRVRHMAHRLALTASLAFRRRP